MPLPTLTIGATNQSAKIRSGSMSVKFNTLDVALYDPVVIPAIDDVVTLSIPAWSGVVTKVATTDVVNKKGHQVVLVSASYVADPLASQGPFDLHDTPLGGGNLLTANQASIETDVTGWAVTVNCTIAQTAAQAHDGTKALQLTSVAGGDMAAQDSTNLPVVPGETYTVSGWVRSAVSARSTRLDLFWFKADGVTPSSVRASDVGTSVADSAAAWTVLPALTAIAPSDAVFAVVKVRVLATGAAAEVHYFDQLGLAMGTTPWVAGGTRPTFGYSGLSVQTQRNTDGELRVTGRCVTKQGGLWPAHTFLLTSTNQGIAAQSFTVTNVTVTWLTKDVEIYTIEFGDPIVTMSVWMNSAASGQITTTKITDGAISTPKLAAGSVTADKLEAVLVLANKLVGGVLGAARTEMDAAGFRGYDISENLIINIPNDGSPLSLLAQVIASSLLVTGNAVLTGTQNEVAMAAVVQLDASQGNPSLKPSLAQGWDTLTIPRNATVDGVVFSRWCLEYDAAGGAAGTTKVFYQIAFNDQNNIWYLVEIKCSDLTVNRSMAFGVSAQLYSLCRLGSYIYLLFHFSGGWRVYRYVQATWASTPDATYIPNMPTATPNFPSMCSDGTNLFIADTVLGGALSWNKYDGNMVKQGSTIATGYTPPTKPSDCAAGNFDFGAFRMVTSDHGGSVHVFDSAGARQVNEEFFFPSSTFESGIAYGDALGDGARFWTTPFQTQTLVKHSTWTWTTASAIYWVAYSWYDSAGTTHETQAGPRASITMGRRKKLTVTAAILPGTGGADEPNNIRFYMAPNATDPGLTNLKLQATQAAQTVALSTYNSGGAADPGSNGFGSGTPGEFKTQVGGISIKGDGSAVFGSGLNSGNYRFRATASATQVLSSGVWATLNFDTEQYDSNSNFNTTTHVYTVPVTGYYLMIGAISGSPTVRIGVRFNKNAGTFLATTVANSTTNARHEVVGLAFLTAGDTITCEGFGDSATLTVQGQEFSMHLLSL